MPSWVWTVVFVTVGFMFGPLVLVGVGWLMDHMPKWITHYWNWASRKAFGPGLFEDEPEQ